MCSRRFFKQLLTAKYYLVFFLRSRHARGYGIHSPAIFEFVHEVIFDHTHYEAYEIADAIRSRLEYSEQEIVVEEIGEGSGIFSQKLRRVSDMVRRSSINSKYGKLLYRISHFYSPGTIIELGTSVGISSIYLAMGNNKTMVYTVEGNDSLCDFAENLFKNIEIPNIRVIHGYFDAIIENKNKLPEHIGMVFIDGNHNKEATLRYFNHFIDTMEEGLIVLDDIHWSPVMYEAWKTIVADHRTLVTIELLRFGIIFNKKGLGKQNYRVRF